MRRLNARRPSRLYRPPRACSSAVATTWKSSARATTRTRCGGWSAVARPSASGSRLRPCWSGARQPPRPERHLGADRRLDGRVPVPRRCSEVPARTDPSRGAPQGSDQPHGCGRRWRRPAGRPRDARRSALARPGGLRRRRGRDAAGLWTRRSDAHRPHRGGSIGIRRRPAQPTHRVPDQVGSTCQAGTDDHAEAGHLADQPDDRGPRVRGRRRQLRPRRGARTEAEELSGLPLTKSGAARRRGRSTGRLGDEAMERPEVMR